jgi:hypothetical protein
MSNRRDGFSIFGLGAAACVACCIGPIVAFLGGLSIAGLASTLLIGTAGLAITAGALIAILALSRRRAAAVCGTDPAEPLAVGPPTRRVST